VARPTQPSGMNGIQRKGKLTLDASGNLKGDISEIRVGDRAWSQRWALRTVTNLQVTDQPFGFDYSFLAENYAKNAGNLPLVRPRVIESKSSALLETKEARKFPIEFDGPLRDSDTFEIVLPRGMR